MTALRFASSRRLVWQFLCAVVCIASLGFAAPPAMAHGDDDHGGDGHGAAAPAATSAGPRVAAHSEDFELVGIPSARQGGTLLVYLTTFRGNDSVKGAVVEITKGDETITGAEKDDVYTFKTPWVMVPGRHDLTFSVNAGDKHDLLIGTLDIPPAPPPSPTHDSVWDHIVPVTWSLPHIPLWLVVASLGLALALTFLAATVRRPLRRFYAFGAVLAGAAGLAVFAVPADDHRHATGDQPRGVLLDLPEASRRFEDASVFIPKPTQRLLGIETVEANTSESVQKTARLLGQVVPDPNRSGVVQTLLAGRVESPASGFPVIGSPVEKGDLLGYLVPRVELVDQSDITQTLGDLDKQIALLEAKLKRIEPLSGAAVPASQITDTKIELEILRKRRNDIKPVLKEREELVAPADGILAQVNVVAGQVVEAQTILFQIVDPSNLWVEALVFDAATAMNISRLGNDAFAQTADGRKVALSFVGRSPSLRQQAVPLRFKIKGDGGAFNVGEPVSVYAAMNEPVSAITLPRPSVVRSANGQSIVWAHIDAERFQPRVVKTEPIDAERLGVTAGIAAGNRIVIRGAELINQVR